MHDIILKLDEINYTFSFAFVKGTGNETFDFGFGNENHIKVAVNDFYISKFVVTQKLWQCIMSYNPSRVKNEDKPVTDVSYKNIVSGNGFIACLNKKFPLLNNCLYRLPSETEWEYAARGGKHWKDLFTYSGSNDINEVAWYDKNSNNKLQPSGKKKSNQLDIYDMSGNIWEWCADYFQRDINKIPLDGSACLEESSYRVVRGGSFKNWSIHCTVMKRYEINPDLTGGDVGFRLVLQSSGEKLSWPSPTP